MSSILKALKKLEDGRNPVGRRKSAVVESVILEESLKKRSTGNLFLLFLLSAIAFIATGIAITLFYYRSPSKLPATIQIQKLTPEDTIRKILPLKPATAESAKGAARPSAAPVKKEEKRPEQMQEATKPQPPPVPQKTARPKPELNGIAFRAGESATNIAIINGKAVGVGGTVDGARVEEIHKDRVRLDYSGEKLELVLSR